MQVKEIMKKAVTISPKIIVKEAVKIMSQQNIGSLVVIDKQDKLVGIVTERDILKFFSKSGKPNVRVDTIMSKNVKFIDSEASLSEAAGIMSENRVKRLPVIEDEKIVGIITASDLVANADSFDEPFFFF